MLDYRGLEAISAVIETQNFQAAAEKLFITQSAVTQRIQQIEAYFGQPLLIRNQPYRATKMGEKLLGLLRQTQLLEQHLLQDLDLEERRPEIKIALNRDSLETWYLQALGELPILKQAHCDLITDDQDLTIDYFKQGLVNACLSTQARALPGCAVEPLGTMEYCLVASPAFINKHFKALTTVSLLKAPALIFDQKDSLHRRYLETFFGIKEPMFNCQTLPSVRGFTLAAKLGLGYGLIPKIDILEELKTGVLIDLFPDNHWPMALYWHYWQIETPYYRQFNQSLIEFARKILVV